MTRLLTHLQIPRPTQVLLTVALLTAVLQTAVLQTAVRQTAARQTAARQTAVLLTAVLLMEAAAILPPVEAQQSAQWMLKTADTHTRPTWTTIDL